MIDSSTKFSVGDQVQWMAGSRLAGFQGTIVEPGCVWSFVKVSGSGAEEYTKTALLEPLDKKSDRT